MGFSGALFFRLFSASNSVCLRILPIVWACLSGAQPCCIGLARVFAFKVQSVMDLGEIASLRCRRIGQEIGASQATKAESLEFGLGEVSGEFFGEHLPKFTNPPVGRAVRLIPALEMDAYRSTCNRVALSFLPNMHGSRGVESVIDVTIAFLCAGDQEGV